MLRGIEEAGVRIAVSFLPATEGRTGRIAKFSIDPDREPKSGEVALYLAPFCLGEADLSFALLSRLLVSSGRRIRGLGRIVAPSSEYGQTFDYRTE